jgi:AcrR family transcriptional regulator
MNRVVNTPSRRYSSQLREEQARETRDRILEATIRVMATGVANASIPAIAREAGVSVPTVYRNFPTKDALFREIYPYLVRRAGAGGLVWPTSLADLGGSLRSLFGQLDALDDVTRAAMVSGAGDEVRHGDMERRLAMTGRLVDIIAPQLSEADRVRLTRLLVVLTMSAALRMWRDHLGLTVDEAVDEVDWAIRSIIQGSAGTPE